MSCSTSRSRLCEEGDRQQNAGDLEAALATFREALAQVPKKKQLGSYGAWLYVAPADALYLLHRFEEAKTEIAKALLTGDLGNAIVHLRAGTIRCVLGDHEEAESELFKAFLLGGGQVFAEEDPKLLAFATARARPPEGMTSWKGWRRAPKGSDIFEWAASPALYRPRRR